MKDLDAREIIANAEKVNHFPCIYFLIDDGEIVYVGQSRKMLARFHKHLYRKKFDSYFILPIDPSEDLDDAEMHYVTKFNPRLNVIKMLPRSLVKTTAATPFERVIERINAGQTAYTAAKSEGFNPSSFYGLKAYREWKSQQNIDQ